jgi:hypothetical protein
MISHVVSSVALVGFDSEVFSFLSSNPHSIIMILFASDADCSMG